MGKFSDAISSAKDTASTVLKPVKFVASATIGIPVAMALTAVMVCLAGILKGMDICWSVASKSSKSIFKTELYYEPFLHDLSAWMWDKTKSIWTDYGVYAHLTAAKWGMNAMNKVASHHGLSHDATVIGSESKYTDRSSLEEIIREESEKDQRKKELEIKRKEEFKKGLSDFFDMQGMKKEFEEKEAEEKKRKAKVEYLREDEPASSPERPVDGEPLSGKKHKDHHHNSIG